MGTDVSQTPPRIAILGAGSIGQSFAAAFAGAGHRVALFEPDASRRRAAAEGIALHRRAMREAGHPDSAGTPDITDTLAEATTGADLVLECGPEDLTIKQAIFAELLAHLPDDAVLATASSAITMSRILPDAGAQRRCLVAHPVNPPAVLRLIELVPAPGTSPETVARAAELFSAAGFETVTLGHEIEGFVLNRLQGAVLREAYRLVQEGVATSTEIDTVMRMGLGPRWALSGPFETAELNTPGGIRAHAARMGPAYRRMGEARGETVDWSPDLIDRVEAERREVVPENALESRRAWRTRAVARLVAARDRIADTADD